MIDQDHYQRVERVLEEATEALFATNIASRTGLTEKEVVTVLKRMGPAMLESTPYRGRWGNKYSLIRSAKPVCASGPPATPSSSHLAKEIAETVANGAELAEVPAEVEALLDEADPAPTEADEAEQQAAPAQPQDRTGESSETPAAVPYSMDADPQGIRALVSDTIAGALLAGYQGSTAPSEGHWITQFWQFGQEASRSAEALDEADANARDIVGKALGLNIPGRTRNWAYLEGLIKGMSNHLVGLIEAMAKHDAVDVGSASPWLWCPDHVPPVGAPVIILDQGVPLLDAEVNAPTAPWTEVECWWMPLPPPPAGWTERASPPQVQEEIEISPVAAPDTKEDPAMDALQTGGMLGYAPQAAVTEQPVEPGLTRMQGEAFDVSIWSSGPAEAMLDLITSTGGDTAFSCMEEASRQAYLRAMHRMVLEAHQALERFAGIGQEAA